MIGYKGDTIVYILIKEDKEFAQIEWKQIEIRNIKNGDYIQVYHLPSRSFCFYPVKVVSGVYDGMLYKTHTNITFCKDQKLFACKYFPGIDYPIIDEKSLEEFKEDETLVTISGWSYELNPDAESGEIKDMVEHMSHREKSRYCYNKVDRLEIKEERFQGELYNIVAPIEYGLRIGEYGIGTIIHE